MDAAGTTGYVYDEAGQLLSEDGPWGNDTVSYSYQNRLRTQLSLLRPNAPAWEQAYAYDGAKRLTNVTSPAGDVGGPLAIHSTLNSQPSTFLPVYDGMLVIQERNASNLPVAAYTRGLDLSASLQGAGGIGGLLAFSTLTTVSPQHYYYYADGNGNVAELLDAQQLVAAQYLYDSFGNLIYGIGPLAEANRYRFSSKEFQGNAGLYYYGYRFYDPNLQRWVSRDPIGEWGGINLHRAIENAPVNYHDAYGQIGVLAAIVYGKLLWEGACASYALNNAIAWDPPNDPCEYKKHCLVGCKMNKCQAGFSVSSILGQLLKEAVWAAKDGRIDWTESMNDTVATLRGHLYGWKLFFGDCEKDCDRKPR